MDLLDWAGLAATTAGTALLYTLTGFGFAVLATPLLLLFVDPPRAIQLVIIISTALSVVALPGLWRAIAPRPLLRLGLGSRLYSEPCFPHRDHRRPGQNLAFGRDPDPFAFIGGLLGRPLGDRVGADAFAILAILLLGAAVLYTLAVAAGPTPR